MLSFPHWMIVYGTDRNSGKTTLITRIIEHFSKDFPICAIKISPHFHIIDDPSKIIYQTDDCIIIKENKGLTGKDSSRMVDAGAREVFYMQVLDNNLAEVMPELLQFITPGMAVICESGWARELICPGLFFILHRSGNIIAKESTHLLKPLADKWIQFDGQNFDFNISQIKFSDNRWSLSRNDTEDLI